MISPAAGIEVVCDSTICCFKKTWLRECFLFFNKIIIRITPNIKCNWWGFWLLVGFVVLGGVWSFGVYVSLHVSDIFHCFGAQTCAFVAQQTELARRARFRPLGGGAFGAP